MFCNFHPSCVKITEFSQHKANTSSKGNCKQICALSAIANLAKGKNILIILPRWFIVKIYWALIAFLYMYSHDSFFQYLSILCNAFIACYDNDPMYLNSITIYQGVHLTNFRYTKDKSMIIVYFPRVSHSCLAVLQVILNIDI